MDPHYLLLPRDAVGFALLGLALYFSAHKRPSRMQSLIIWPLLLA